MILSVILSTKIHVGSDISSAISVVLHELTYRSAEFRIEDIAEPLRKAINDEIDFWLEKKKKHQDKLDKRK